MTTTARSKIGAPAGLRVEHLHHIRVEQRAMATTRFTRRECDGASSLCEKICLPSLKVDA